VSQEVNEVNVLVPSRELLRRTSQPRGPARWIRLCQG
jgi:hypothetical protein